MGEWRSLNAEIGGIRDFHIGVLAAVLSGKKVGRALCSYLFLPLEQRGLLHIPLYRLGWHVTVVPLLILQHVALASDQVAGLSWLTLNIDRLSCSVVRFLVRIGQPSFPRHNN